MRKAVTGRILMIFIAVLAAGLFAGNTALAGEDGRKTAVQGSAEKININVATLKELITLPGIGRKKAGAIIAYRTENGKFSSVDELGKVRGIGKKTVEKLKPYVTAP